MRAVRFHEHGDAGVLRYEDAPDPELRGGDALIRVRACGLNHLDIWNRRGVVTLPLPHISGADIAGEIVASADPQFAQGRRVMLQPGLSCGVCAACLDGRDNMCPRYDVLGSQSDGGYAELVRVPLANVIALPDAIGFIEAAAFPLTFLTAWHMLVTRCGIRPGDDVLVVAAGSGVGQAAIQVAVLHGARVFATAGSEEKLARAREIGATDVVNHHTEDVPAAIRRFTGNRGVDIVFEHVGTATWARTRRTILLQRTPPSRRRSHVPARRGRRGAALPGKEPAIREGRLGHLIRSATRCVTGISTVHAGRRRSRRQATG
jgi:NADPH:quinone reductase-like Zn-dependent oxidoreductase